VNNRVVITAAASGIEPWAEAFLTNGAEAFPRP